MSKLKCKHVYVTDCGGEIVGMDGIVVKIKGKGTYCVFCKRKAFNKNKNMV